MNPFFYLNNMSFQWTFCFLPQLIFSVYNVLVVVPPWACEPQVMPKAYVEGG